MSIKRLFRAPQAKIKFSVIDFFGKYDKIHIFFCIWLNLLKKYLIENFNFYFLCSGTFCH